MSATSADRSRQPFWAFARRLFGRFPADLRGPVISEDLAVSCWPRVLLERPAFRDCSMERIFLVLSLAVLGGCSIVPLSFLAREAARDADVSPASPITLQPSIALGSPPAAPAPLQPETGFGDSAFVNSQARALEGDRDAAFRVAQMFREGSNGVPRDERRMVRWLRHASELENPYASYQLYLHYLSRGLDRDAVRYENRALRQGFTPPPRLDHRRG